MSDKHDDKKKKKHIKPLQLKIRAKPGRGSLDAVCVTGAIAESWKDIQDAFNVLDSEDQDALKEFFNGLCSEYENCGDHLFGADSEDFQGQMGLLDDEIAQEIVDGIFESKLIDKEHLAAQIEKQ